MKTAARPKAPLSPAPSGGVFCRKAGTTRMASAVWEGTGVRYLNPQTSLWLSVDPAMGEYVPGAPINDEVKKRNQNLPGMGGVFNLVNLHVYHYAGNNPVKYIDPDGDFIILIQFSANAGIGEGVDFNGGIFLSFNGNGDISMGFYHSEAIGAYISRGASVGVGVTLAPFAERFSDIEGFSLVAGGTFKCPVLPGGKITGEIGYNPTTKNAGEKRKSLTFTATVSLKSFGLPYEGHVYTVKTSKIVEINLSKLERDVDIEKIKTLIREEKYYELGQYIIDLEQDCLIK